jgi:hypothetical protein
MMDPDRELLGRLRALSAPQMTEACQPLAPEARARIAAAAVLAFNRSPARVGPAAPLGEPAARAATAGDGRPAIRRRLGPAGVVGAAAGLLAAVLYLGSPRGPAGVRGPGLPDYALEVSGGAKGERGPSPAQALVLAPATRFVLILRPQEAAAARVAARAFFVTGQRVDELGLVARVSDEGAVKWEGRGYAGWGVAGSRGQLVIQLAQPGASIPPVSPAASAAEGAGPGVSSGPGWRRWRLDVELR